VACKRGRGRRGGAVRCEAGRNASHLFGSVLAGMYVQCLCKCRAASQALLEILEAMPCSWLRRLRRTQPDQPGSPRMHQCNINILHRFYIADWSPCAYAKPAHRPRYPTTPLPSCNSCCEIILCMAIISNQI